MRDWRFWALLGGFGLVLVLQLATPQLDSDQAVTGLMGLHILRGEFPIFFWSQNHAGVPESYGAAVSFFAFGMSRLALNLVPAFAAIGFVLALYRTGAVLFGHGAGLLAIVFATIVSPYVASHYVRARAYYIEHLLLGQIVLLGAALYLARPRGEAARARGLVAMGLAGGVGLYCGFQIVNALVPAALAVLLVDPRAPGKRGVWLGLGAFLLGSVPFWIHNLTHEWATFATGVRFQARTSAGSAARSVFGDLIPVVLGVQEYVGTPPYLRWPLSLVVPVVVVGAVSLLAVRVARRVTRVRRDPALSGEALLLAALTVVVGAVWYGRYTQVPRYLVPLAPVVALVLARAVQLVWRRVPILAVAAVASYLGAVGAGLVHEFPVFWPSSRAAYWAARAEDGALLAFLRARGLERAYSFEYWLAPRLTFDAREAVIVAEPFNDRHPPYTDAVDASPHPAYVVRGDVERVQNWIRGIRSSAQQAIVGPYTVFWGFTTPPPVAPVPRAEWVVRASHGKGDAQSVADARLATGWSGAPGRPARAWLDVDLGQPRRIAGVTMISDQPARVPQLLEVYVGAREESVQPVARLDTGGYTIAWRNGAPRTRPSRTLTLRFPAVETHRLRLVDTRDGGSWAVAELFVLAPSDGPEITPEAVREGRRLEDARMADSALLRYREAMQTAPDNPAGYAEFARLAAAIGLRAPNHVEQARRYARLGLVEEAWTAYTQLAASLGPEVVHVELTRERARLAAAADPAGARRLDTIADRALAPRQRLGAVFGRVVTLTGYEIEPTRVEPGDALQVTYHWRLLAKPSRPLVAYVHFRSPAVQFGDDHGLPELITGFPTPQHVAEYRRVVVPADMSPGRYRIVVGVWDPGTGWRARRWWRGLLPTFENTVELDTVEVLPRHGAAVP